MHRVAAVLLLGLLGTVGLAGCSSSGSPSGAAPTPSGSSVGGIPTASGTGGPTATTLPTATPTSTPRSTPRPTGSRSTGTARPVPRPSGSIAVDGVVQRGVEPGCFVLRAGAKSYLLLRTDGGEGAQDVPVAVPVRVTGRVVTGVASYCQQGTPLRVDTITRR
jgi:hypothetical protein